MTGSGFEVREFSGVTLIRCRPLEALPGLAHAFSTRLDRGDRGFDLGRTGDQDPRTLERRGRFLRAAGILGEAPAIVRQVHGRRVVRASEADGEEEADAVLWLPGDPQDRPPSVRTADCVPILLADRHGGAFAAVHSGWRGTAERVASRAVDALVSAGFRRASIVAALGPAILPCCYEVGDEVASRVEASSPGARAVLPGPRPGTGPRVDLHAAIRAQLETSGLPPAAIHEVPLCVRCRADLFFSHRRDGAAAGRMMASIGFAREPRGPGADSSVRARPRS